MTSVIKGGAALFGAYFFRLPRKSNGQPLWKPEEGLTVRCADFLRLAAPPDVFFCHIPNEGKRSPVGHFIQEAMGRVTGMLDLLVICPRNGTFCIEVKVDKNRPTAEQLEAARRIVIAGGRCAVVNTFEEFTSQVIAWGIVPA